ncbi:MULTISPECIES: hypothetical protein [unclassified Pannonibacter]|uniref:hypothetical protein n=1 Tax=unclassified Pannonibacter TaxID=2627228 RepID=UPI00164514F4|nr:MULTISPECIES: hypothetical protein [unclassified Pannonibacter]
MSKTMHPLPKRSASAVELPAGDEGLRSKGLRLALGSEARHPSRCQALLSIA